MLQLRNRPFPVTGVVAAVCMCCIKEEVMEEKNKVDIAVLKGSSKLSKPFYWSHLKPSHKPNGGRYLSG